MDKRASDGEVALWKHGKKGSPPPSSPGSTSRKRKKSLRELRGAADTIFDAEEDPHLLSGIGIQFMEKKDHASDTSALAALAVSTLFNIVTLRNNWLNIIEYVNNAGDLTTFTTPDWVCTVSPPSDDDNSDVTLRRRRL
jgi:hypothetical protein